MLYRQNGLNDNKIYVVGGVTRECAYKFFLRVISFSEVTSGS